MGYFATLSMTESAKHITMGYFGAQHDGSVVLSPLFIFNSFVVCLKPWAQIDMEQSEYNNDK